MLEDGDFDFERPPARNERELIHDLDLNTLLVAMANGDKFLYEIAKATLMLGLDDPAAIVYRQHILEDCLAHPEVIRELHAIVVDAIEAQRHAWGVWSGYAKRHPSSALSGSVEALKLYVVSLRRLRQLADDRAALFVSEGLARLFATLKLELDDDYFRAIDEHLQQLKFRNGMVMSVRLGAGTKGIEYVLAPGAAKRTWKDRMRIGGAPSYSFEIHPRDDAGLAAMTELRDRGLNAVANAVRQSTEHIRSFFDRLASELGFYVGCLNLHDRLAEKGEAICTPLPVSWDPPRLAFSDLHDICLTLRTTGSVVGNDVNANGRQVIMITGANSGGKSTFLRSVGVAQLMMRCGMFVTAGSYLGSVWGGLYTHFIREEDATMTSGKLDEELSRMNWIAEGLTAGSVVLFNESFSATNEREGSEIARQVVHALVESDIRVLFVTHLFDLAESFHVEHHDTTLFLRAERQEEGQRNFKLVEGGPLPTSYGEDVYDRIGDWAPAATGGSV